MGVHVNSNQKHEKMHNLTNNKKNKKDNEVFRFLILKNL